MNQKMLFSAGGSAAVEVCAIGAQLLLELLQSDQGSVTPNDCWRAGDAGFNRFFSSWAIHTIVELKNIV